MKTLASKYALLTTLALALVLNACHQQYNKYESGDRQAPPPTSAHSMDEAGHAVADSLMSPEMNTEEYDRIVENELPILP